MRFKFYIKKNGSDKIFISITHQGERERFSTGFTVDNSEHWDKSKQRLTNKHARYKTINRGLYQIDHKLKLIRDTLITEQKPLSASIVRKRFEGQDEETFWKRWSQFKKEYVSGLSFGSQDNYQLIEKHLKAFEIKDGEIKFTHINISFYNRLINYFRPLVIENTRNGYIAKIKTFLNYSYKAGWVKSDQGWINWKSTTKRPMREGVFYTLDQLKMLEQMEIKKGRYEKRRRAFDKEILEKVRKIFIFQCYTGLRFSDMGQLSNLSPTFTGHLVIDNIKSRKRRNVFLVEKSKELFSQIQSFDGFSMDSETYNVGIKMISKQFGWSGEVLHRGKIIPKWEAFSSHAARYSFISIVSAHAPGMIVKGLADHSDLKTTEGYFQQNQAQMEDAMKKAFG